MALSEPSRAGRAPLAEEGGYAYHYSHSAASKPFIGARQSAPTTSYSNVTKETRERIKRYDEQTKQIEEQEQQRMQQYKLAHAKQAVEKRKGSRLPLPLVESKLSTKPTDSYVPINEVKEKAGTTFTNILNSVYQEVSGGRLQGTAFMDSCVPFLRSEVQGAKTFVQEENRAISETHQLAMCSVQNKLPPSKIKGGSADRRNERRHANEFSISSTDTSTANLSSQTRAKTTAPAVPPEDEYLNSANSNDAAGLQRAIDDVRQLPAYAESSDEDDCSIDNDYNKVQQDLQVVKPMLTSSIHLEPHATDSYVHTHVPSSMPTHEHLADGIMRLSPILQSKEVESKDSKTKPKPRSQAPPKVFEGLETVKLNRNLAKCTDEEEALKRELSELDKKLANYSVDTTNMSHQTGISISILSDYPPKRPSKTLEDLAYGSPDDDLTDEQRQQKRLDYLRHQQMHDGKAVKESLSNAAVGQHQFRLQNIDQLKAQQPDRRQPSATNKGNKTQYSAVAPLSNSTSSNANSTSNASASNNNGRGKSAQVAGPIRRVMRRTSAKQNLSEPKPLPAVLASSGGPEDSTASQEVHVSNHQLLKSLFSGPLDASQGVGYGVLNVVKTKSRSEPCTNNPQKQQELDLKFQVQVHANNHTHQDESEDEDSEVRIAVVNCQENYSKRSVHKPVERQSQQDRRGPRSNTQHGSEQCEDDHAISIGRNPVRSVIRNFSREPRPSVNSHNEEKAHSLQAPDSSEHRSSVHKLARRTTPPATTVKNQVRQKSVTFTDEREHTEDENNDEIEAASYSNQYTGLQAHHRDVKALDNEFLPKYGNLTVSDLLDDDGDALDDYDFSA